MRGNGHIDGWMEDRSWELWIACGLVLLVVALVAALVVSVLWNRAPQRPASEPERSSALRTLEQRYAAGDIDDDEFRQRRALLGG